MANQIDLKLKKLKSLDEKIKELTDRRDLVRGSILATMDKWKMDQYRGELAVVSREERKTIKFVKKEEEVLGELETQGLVKYIQVVPEHKELNKDFSSDIKEGVLKIEGVNVEVKINPMIRFNRESDTGVVA